MGTITVKVAPGCDSLISHLSRESEWELISENYGGAGIGEIVIRSIEYADGAAPLEAGETQPTKRRPERAGNVAKRQRDRDARLKQAAELSGFGSIDQLANAINAGTHIVSEK